MANSYRVEPLVKGHDRKNFSCGNQALDDYLQKQAGQDLRRRIAAPFVLVEQGDKIVKGYYTLSAIGVELADLPEAFAKKLPLYPVVPATLLGRLAVDSSLHGQGLGELLLMDALHRAFMQSSQIAAAAVIVDAIDEAARRFYLHFDFLPFPKRHDRLFVPLKTIAALFD